MLVILILTMYMWRENEEHLINSRDMMDFWGFIRVGI
jgi:hypothetical protein